MCQKYDNSPTALKNQGHQQKGLAVQKLSISYERASSMKIHPPLPQGQGSQDHSSGKEKAVYHNQMLGLEDVDRLCLIPTIGE